MTEAGAVRRGRYAPLATYRLQFNNAFTFADAEAIIPYLAELGISHVYASPYLKARAGSTHGYDITDHNALNPEVGDEAQFLAFCDAIDRHGMGQILDFVPNHMGIGLADNAWWLDVLEWGEASPYAEYFDIDWQAAKPELRHKVLVPSLGDHYGKILEAGELKLAFDDAEGSFSVWYYQHRFPVTPGEYTPILQEAVAGLRADAEDETGLVELELLLAGFRDLRRQLRSGRQRSVRRAKADRLKGQLAELARDRASVRAAIDRAMAMFNGAEGKPAGFQKLHRLLQAQPYRLAFWRVAAEEINYRRFFQINDLAGIRVEEPEVFEDVHRFVLDLIAAGRLHGLRIDHIDGLFDPKNYLVRLQNKAREKLAASGDADADGSAELYIVVEKILALHERLRDDWPIAGTTGYEVLNRINGLFVDPDGEPALDRLYAELVGGHPGFERMAYDAKKQAMDLELASELRVLANQLNRLAETSWLTRDHTLVGLRQALRELVASFPVYRTYVGRSGASTEDRRDIDWAIAHARRRSQRIDMSVFDFLYGVVTMDYARGRRGPYSRREVQRLAMKVQQYTGPVMAKGVEDAAFYRFNRLSSLNEVGGEPNHFGLSVAAFHRQAQEQARRWPHTMVCTATHDTKRGEDVRARINVLSEIPDEWAERVQRWMTLNQRRKSEVSGAPAPTVNDEYLFYQTIIGAWPLAFTSDAPIDPGAMDGFRERLVAYMLKAVREAKVHSMWIQFNEEYEGAIETFITRVLDVANPNPFVADVQAFHDRIAPIGVLNGLAQTILKLTIPGVPDIYQGCELWELSLVDPDNRRPVDFTARAKQLQEIKGMRGNAARDLLDVWRDGGIKMYVIWKLLQLRQSESDLFRDGAYVPVDAQGASAPHLTAFLRTGGEQPLLVAVPRLVAGLMGEGGALPIGAEAWADTAVALPDAGGGRRWRNIFTDEVVEAVADTDGALRLPLADVFATVPFAVCVPAPPASPA